jgi:hypothetical protein
MRQFLISLILSVQTIHLARIAFSLLPLPSPLPERKMYNGQSVTVQRLTS